MQFQPNHQAFMTTHMDRYYVDLETFIKLLSMINEFEKISDLSSLDPEILEVALSIPRSTVRIECDVMKKVGLISSQARIKAVSITGILAEYISKVVMPALDISSMDTYTATDIAEGGTLESCLIALGNSLDADSTIEQFEQVSFRLEHIVWTMSRVARMITDISDMTVLPECPYLDTPIVFSGIVATLQTALAREDMLGDNPWNRPNRRYVLATLRKYYDGSITDMDINTLRYIDMGSSYGIGNRLVYGYGKDPLPTQCSLYLEYVTEKIKREYSSDEWVSRLGYELQGEGIINDIIEYLENHIVNSEKKLLAELM